MRAGKRFKLDVKDRIIMVLVYCSLCTSPIPGCNFYLVWTRATYAGI